MSRLLMLVHHKYVYSLFRKKEEEVWESDCETKIDSICLYVYVCVYVPACACLIPKSPISGHNRGVWFFRSQRPRPLHSEVEVRGRHLDCFSFFFFFLENVPFSVDWGHAVWPQTLRPLIPSAAHLSFSFFGKEMQKKEKKNIPALQWKLNMLHKDVLLLFWRSRLRKELW